METQTIIYQDINWLKNDFKVTRLFSLPDNFKLEMAILTKREVDDYNEKLQALSTENGYKLARLGVGICLFFYLILLATGTELLPGASQLLIISLFAISGALLGKVFSLVINYSRLTQIIKEIDKKISARRPQKQKKANSISYAMG